MYNLKLDQRGFELKAHGSANFPYRSSRIKICNYEGKRFSTHWHNELEFTLITKGSLYYQANNQTYVLRTGDGIFVNAGVLHSAWQCGEEPCTYIPITIAPSLIADAEQDIINQKYIQNLIADETFTSLYLNRENERHQRILELLSDCHTNFKKQPDYYELQIKINLCLVWKELFQEYSEHTLANQFARNAVWHGKDVKKAVTYIKEHYQEQITLTDIASYCGLSREALCRKFKKSIRQSPVEFLMHYRIRCSLNELLSHSNGITQVALNSGFQSASYYSKIFKRYMNMTPSEYIKKNAQ